MAQRLFRISVLSILTLVLVLGGGSARPDLDGSDARGPLPALLGSGPSEANAQPELLSTIVFGSTRDDPTTNPFSSSEIYLMDPDPDPAKQHPQRLTNDRYGDAYPSLSPDGKWIVFDSNRLRSPSEQINTFDLFLMKSDGKGLKHLVRGSSVTWAPDSRKIAFHASASHNDGQHINPDPGAATLDSDLFVVDVFDLLDGVAQPINITNNGGVFIEDDAEWSPDGQSIVYARYKPPIPGGDGRNIPNKELWLLRVDQQGHPLPDDPTQDEDSPRRNPQRLTFNNQEERGPTWSPNGDRILYMCRRGSFQFCVLDKLKVNGTWDGMSWEPEKQLTFSGQHLGPSWSPDGSKIVFPRALPVGSGNQHLFWLTLDNGTCGTPTTTPPPPEGTCSLTQLTFPPDPPGFSFNSFPHWGVVRREGPPATVTSTPFAAAIPSPTATSTPSLTPTATQTGP